MKKLIIIIFACVIFTYSCKEDDKDGVPNSIQEPENIYTGKFPVVFETGKFSDANNENTEPRNDYNFGNPFVSKIWEASTYNPGECDMLIRDGYGPRTLSDSYDLHGGIDWSHCHENEGVHYDEDNLPPLYSMCDGVVKDVRDDLKCSVFIICDQKFANKDMEDENVELIYRHLEQFNPTLIKGDRVSKGDNIGIMGKCGANLEHLHWNCRYYGEDVHGGRVLHDFIEKSDHLKRFDDEYEQDVVIKVLSSDANSTILRYIVPGNIITTVEIGVELQNETIKYNFENVTASSNNSSERDDPCYLGDKLCVYVYGFDGVRSACSKYESEAEDLPSDFPGSKNRGEGNYYPIECDGGLASEVAIVYDVVLKISVSDLEKEINLDTFKPYIAGVFGDVVRSTGIVN